MTEQLSATPEIPDKEPLTIEYDVVNAGDVIAHWMRGYAEGMSRKILEEYDWYYDTNKAAFIFKLYVRRTSERVPREELLK